MNVNNREQVSVFFADTRYPDQKYEYDTSKSNSKHFHQWLQNLKRQYILQYDEEIVPILTIIVTLLFALFVITGSRLIYYVNNPDAFDMESKSETIATVPIKDDYDRIEKGIHIRTGLIDA
ncbi:MAG: hypothetical protein ACI902_003155 [Psychroserpens sp.]